ncbi:MAG: hypothetical protein JW839_10485 [Candidatus Lokiarchaeota archaeon]|nr:hypothetical protein [Candidatus Lokiarchaeota archaeon]
MGTFSLGRLKAAMLKDVEMPRKQWLKAHLTTINFYISVISGECVLILKGFEFRTYAYFLAIGIVAGFVVAYILSDRTKQKYRFIFILFAVNFIIFQLIYFDVFIESTVVLSLLLTVRAALWILILASYFQVMNQTTGVLERGRIYCSTAAACTVLMPFLAAGTRFLEFNFYFNLFNLPYIVIMMKMGSAKQEFFTPDTPLRAAVTSGDVPRYLLILSLFGFSEGLLSPNVLDIATGFNVLFWGPFLLALGLLLLGFVYDAHGRRITLVIKVLVFASFGFLYIFEETLLLGDFIMRTFIALLIVSIASVFVIMGDISPRTAKVFLVGMVLLLASALGGVMLKEAWVAVPELDLLPRFLAMFLLIITTAIISNTRDIFSRAERNWYDDMITLFVIHDSGILLFYKRFSRDQDGQSDGLLGPDLISAGLIGISNFVCEILKGNRFISGIENYPSKIMLEKGEKVIAALVVHQDLRILREKLKRFLNDFEGNFKPISSELIAIGPDDIKVAEGLINAHFKRSQHRDNAFPRSVGGELSTGDVPASTMQ